MTAIATASTTNCTKRMISRVNKKNRATMPTIPRNSGPKSPCRYDTRPFVLSDKGAVATSEWNDIGLLRGKGIADEQRTQGNRMGAGSRLPTGLGGRGDALDVPGALLLHNGQRISHLEVRGRVSALGCLAGLPGDFPHDRGDDVTDVATGGCRDASDRTEYLRPAQAGHRGPGGKEPAKSGLVSDRIGREKGGQLP